VSSSRFQSLSDEQWERIEPLLPSNESRRGRPFHNEDEIAARKRKGSAGGRPPALDAATYKRRNVVERSFSLTKQWRGLATRYDKLAITYRAAVVLSACITWTRI
jgi:transposase